MKTTLHLAGIALFAAGMVALLLGVREFYAALFICAGSLVAAFSGGWEITKKGQLAGLAFMVLMSGVLLVHAFTEEGVCPLGGLRTPWIGIPLLTAVVVLGVLRVRRFHERNPNQPPQRNAGSRRSSDDPPASEIPSSLGPRG